MKIISKSHKRVVNVQVILSLNHYRRSVVAEWSKSVALKAGVSQRRLESGRRQTVTVTACTLWQGRLNLSATSPVTTSDAETDAKLNFLFLFFHHANMTLRCSLLAAWFGWMFSKPVSASTGSKPLTGRDSRFVQPMAR